MRLAFDGENTIEFEAGNLPFAEAVELKTSAQEASPAARKACRTGKG
jgi:hypothetical protein